MQSYRNTSSPRDNIGQENGEERPAKRQKESHGQDPARQQEVGLMRNGGSVTSASFVGSASGIHFIRSVYSAMVGRTPNTHGETPESNLVPGEDDRLETGNGVAISRQIWQPHEVNLEDHHPGIVPFTFDELLDWSASYFDIWHPAYPFLHAPSVLESFEKFAQNGVPLENTFEVIIMKTIISISLCDRRQRNHPTQRPVPKCLVFTTFDEALESVQPALTKAATIQALQSVAWRTRDKARISDGSSSMSCKVLLLYHRRTTATSTAFWSIYCIDRHLCQALGLPLTIRDDDVDVCYPDAERHVVSAKNTQSSKADPQTNNPPVDGRLRILTLLSKHAQIKGLIMELRNKSVAQRADSLERAMTINAKLTQWWNNVEDSIEQADMQDMPFTTLHKAVFKVLKHESIIALNRPLLTASKKTASYAGALHTCIAASKSIITVLHSLVAPINESTTTSPGQGLKLFLPMFWPSFTWAVWMSAFIMLYAAMENQVETQIAVRYTDRSLQILEKLSARGSIWPSACAIAVRDMRSALHQNGGRSGGGSSTAGGVTERPRLMSTISSVHSDSGISAGHLEHPGLRGDEDSSANNTYYQSHGQDNSPRTAIPQPKWTPPAYPTSQPQPQRTPAQQPSQMPQYGTLDASTTSTRQNLRSGLEELQNQQQQQQQQQVFTPPAGSTSNVQFWNAGSSFPESPFFPDTAGGGSGGSGGGRPWPDFTTMDLGPISEMPPFSVDGLDPLQGFDIPFWMGHDNTAAWMNHN
ncbi:hypothetical protein LTR84_007263 [Exophiala bonariae]|uniref:Xylanolytic transcriptional activator regulatory domain-containing protein n=1 Tax=Exophiala bonariae TaxID=1690606 RepID=A0AAV9N210_9EURO|nr:hypothetical protein LTR84_007263 [Exophiala bonariae]